MVVALEYLVKLGQDVHPLSRLLGALIQTHLHQELQSKWTRETTNSVTATPKNGGLERLTVVKRITQNRSTRTLSNSAVLWTSASTGRSSDNGFVMPYCFGGSEPPAMGGNQAHDGARETLLRGMRRHLIRRGLHAGIPGLARTGRTGTARLLTGLSSARSLSLSLSLPMPNPQAPRCTYTGAIGCKCGSRRITAPG
jgi:hypothetical protein